MKGGGAGVGPRRPAVRAWAAGTGSIDTSRLARPARHARGYGDSTAMALEPGTYARFDTTEGEFLVRLFDKEAPNTVANFVGLAEGTKEWTHPGTRQKQAKPFYDGLIFHRVIDGFMIQGGDPTGTGRGGPGYRFNDEPVKRQYLRGTMAMANAGPNTNGSQFFIMHADYPLPPNYTIFGKLTSGEDVLDSIATAPTGAQDRPVNPVTISSVTVTEA